MLYYEQNYDNNTLNEITKQQYEQRLSSFRREIRQENIQDRLSYVQSNPDEVELSELFKQHNVSNANTTVFHFDSEADIYVIR